MHKNVRRSFDLLLILVVLVTSLGGIHTDAKAASTIFINEIHYDNVGPDTGEAIEIAGPAGTNLAGWSLVLYNGNGGTMYNTRVLSGVIPNQSNGYGTLSFAYPANGIENGSPDGIALVNASSTVVQFLSYEGAFIAIEGPALNLLSTNIGVSEGGSDPIGWSLQLTGGPGTQDTDFTWASAGPATFGAVNTGQTLGIPIPPAPQIVINEFHADPATDLTGDANGDGIRDAFADEFVEIVNISGAALDVSGWTLSDVVGIRHTFPVGSVIPADCNIVVFGGGSPTGTFGNAVVQTASTGAIGLNNGGDTITINDGSVDVAAYSYGSEGGNDQSLTLDPDITGAAFVQHSTATGSGGTLFSPGTKIDGTNFSGCTAGDTTPPTLQTLNPADDATGVAVDSNLVISFDENVQKGTGNITIHLVSDNSVVQTIDVTDAAVTVSGADVIINPPADLALGIEYYVNIPAGAIEDTSGNDYAGITDATTWSFTTGAASVSVLINEVDADQTSTDTAEFLELYDGGAGNTALDGLVVVFFNGSSDTSYAAFDLDTYSTRANGYFVICGNAATVANCDLDVSPDTDLIQNGADAVALYTANAADFPNGTAVTTTNLVDAIVYDTNDADDAGLLVLLNAGQPQVNEGTNNSTVESNQRCPNGSGGARNTSSYAQFNPTPGAENICMNIATQMIINEVDADTPGTDVAEFVELYDGGAGNTALDGLVVVFYNGSNDLSYAAYDLDTYSTSATGYFVLGNAGVPGAGITFASNGLQNGADAVAIYIGDAADFPNGTAVTTTNLLDAIVYDTADSDDAELLVLLNAGQPQVDEDSNSNKDLESSQRCPNGTGGQRNTSSYAQFLPTAGTANVCNNNAIDLELTKTVDDNNPDGGDTITYTLTVSNVSTTQGATNVFVRDYLPNMPAEITSVSFGPCSQGSTAMLPAVEWAVGDLAAGASATCPIQVTVALGTDGTSFENIAEVWSVTETNDGDSTPGNLGAAPAEDDEASVVVQVGVPAACGTTADMIHAIQGTGSASADVGLVRTIEGVVVGDFQTSAGLSGFFVQEEDGDVDANPATSEGIFVNDGGAPAVDVSVGDLVRVTGTVTEFFDLTEITTVTSVLNCGTGTATAAAVTMPVASLDVWEQHEGMLVTIPQTLYTTGHYTLGRYGEVSLSVGGRLSNPTNVAAPGAAAIALKDLNNRSRIQLEDGRTVSNPDPVPYLAADNTLREGDTLPSLTGVLNYAFGAYEIHPVGPLSFTRANPRPAAPPTVGGTVKVASMNVLNYFTTIDAGSPVCGPTGGMDCRGADSAAEFLRQRTKIILAITAMDADVIGLMEMENHPSDAALTDLVNGLNASAGAGTYAAISTGTIGTDAIKVALIYKPATVTPLGAHAILDSSVDPSFIDTKNRPALAQTFVEIASGERFTVAVNHLKSKGSDCNSLGDPDTGDGQGNCNLTRTNAATALVNWLGTDPTGSSDPDFLIIGDLNAYAMEDPITAITSGGYINLISSFLGAGAYSYEFDGESGYLDHALATASLTGQVTGVGEWHINADEPIILDYNMEFNPPTLYQPTVYRASDHDPVLVGLAMGSPPVVLLSANTIPADGSSLTTGPTRIFVEFSKDVLNDGSLDAANNTANYMLLEGMGDGFQTTSCAAGPSTADFSVPINSATYSNASDFIATLGINGGVPLPAGTYRLFVCGTTSITDLSGLELNGGLSDTVVNFTVGAAAELPATGFPQGMVTPLGEQPQDMQYTETVMMLDIPSLGVSTPIVGVPINENGWDITWLGGNAGYLAGTAFPTWNGNTVITAHVWDANNQPGPFANVKSLAYGDTIQIKAWGLTYTYQVRETKLVRSWQVNTVLKEETKDWVTLVTCEDYNDSSQNYATRRVVRAVLVDVR